MKKDSDTPVSSRDLRFGLGAGSSNLPPASANPPIEPHYTVPYSHLLDPPYSDMLDPPLWWDVGGTGTPGPPGPTGPAGPAGPQGPPGTGGGGGVSLAITRAQISTTTIPTSVPLFYTSDGAPWVQTTDTTQPTYTADAGGTGWMLSQSTGFAKLSWFKNASAMAIADWNTTALTGTDNSIAFLEMNAFGRKVCAAGRHFLLDATANHPNHCWGFNFNNCQSALFNLTSFTLDGGGSSFQNIQGAGQSSSTYSPWFSSSIPNANMSALSSGYINSYFPISANAEPGATSVTLTTSGQTASFNIGDWIAIASLSIQYSGYPHNWDRCEFVKITSIGTGTISFTPPLKYEHRIDFPDDVTAAQFPGAAKVIQLNSPSGALYHPPSFTDTISWNVDQLFRNMTLLPAVNSTLTYSSISCRKFRIENCTWVGNSESMCMDFSSFNTVFNAVPEPDKNCSRVHHEKSTWPQGINFQSASFDSVVFNDCVALGNGIGASGRTVIINGGSYSTLATGVNSAGLTRSIIASGAQILACNEPLLWPGNHFTVDGTNIQFVNGTFKCLKSYAALSILIQAPPGSQLAWQPSPAAVGANFMFPGDLGMMTIAKVYQDSTYVYFDTNSPFAGVPSWSDGGVARLATQSVLMNNCIGCDPVRRASEATQRGKPNSLFKVIFFGKFSNSGSWTSVVIGTLTTINVTVRQTTALAGAYFQMEIALFSTTAPSTPAGPHVLRVYIDTSHVGTRVLTTTGFTGTQGNDAITWGGLTAAMTALPANALIGPGIDWYVPVDNTGAPNTMPIIDFELETDTGMLGPLPTMIGSTGGNSVVIPGI
jgi:hypothetical protein